MAVLYSDFTYRYYVLGTALSAIVSLVLFILLFLRGNRELIRYICRLNEEVQILEGGSLKYQVSVEGNDEITVLAESMNRMRESFRQQLETEQMLHRTNRQLITEMSHDLRTPLTEIMLYLEILRSHRYTTEAELQEYLEKIDVKAKHMKQISDHLLAYSLEEARREQAAPQTAEQVLAEPVSQLLDELREKGFQASAELAYPACLIRVNGEYLQRIIGNILSNLEKYAEPAAEILNCTVDTGSHCGLSVMNSYMPAGAEVESTGIGVESIRTMMEQMGGVCTVEQTETAYEITILFRKEKGTANDGEPSGDDAGLSAGCPI